MIASIQSKGMQVDDHFLYSVVVPVYNSEKTIEAVYQQTRDLFAQLGKRFELILVEDGGRDGAWSVMKKLHDQDERVRIAKLARNFGQHNALMAGFSMARGDFIITLDDDLQFPPAEISKLIDKIHQNYDVVYGIPENKNHTFFRRWGSRIITRLTRQIFRLHREVKTSSFRIARKQVVDQILGFRTPYPYISAMLFSATQNVTSIPVKHHARTIGKSNYSIAKLIFLALNLLINYSSIPLVYSCILGLAVSLIAFLVGAWFVLKKLLFGIAVPGWTSLIVLIALLNGMILVVLAVTGQYVVRILGEVIQKPQYIIAEKLD